MKTKVFHVHEFEDPVLLTDSPQINIQIQCSPYENHSSMIFQYIDRY